MRSLTWIADYPVVMRPITKITIFGLRLATCVLALYWIALFTGTHIPVLPKMARSISDKAMHFSAFFGLAFLLCWVWPTDKGVLRKFLLIAFIVLSYAAFDEITQGFVRGRTTDIMDFLADTAGALMSISTYALARKLFLDWSMRRSSVVVE